MISLCITTYNRTDLLFESYAQVLNDDRISEIVIVDDHSSEEVFNKIHEHTRERKKIKLYRNERNLGCYHNKRESVSKACSEWVIVFDSDNIITTKYIDELFRYSPWDKEVVLQPVFAKPHFDFRAYSGKFINTKNVYQYVEESTFTTALNAMNYFVNRDEFLRVFEDRPEPWTADSLLQNYNWRKSLCSKT